MKNMKFSLQFSLSSLKFHQQKRFYTNYSELISQILKAKPSKREAQSFLNQFQPSTLKLLEKKTLIRRNKSKHEQQDINHNHQHSLLNCSPKDYGDKTNEAVNQGHGVGTDYCNTNNTTDSSNSTTQTIEETSFNKKSAILCVDSSLNEHELTQFALTVEKLQTLGLEMIIMPLFFDEESEFINHHHNNDQEELTLNLIWNDGSMEFGTVSMTRNLQKSQAFHQVLNIANSIDAVGGRAMPVSENVLGNYVKSTQNLSSLNFEMNNKTKHHRNPIHHEEQSQIKQPQEASEFNITPSKEEAKYNPFNAIRSAFKLEQVPIILPFAYNTQGKLECLKPSEAVPLLVNRMMAETSVSNPYKLIIVNRHGGFKNDPMSKADEDDDGCFSSDFKRLSGLNTKTYHALSLEGRTNKTRTNTATFGSSKFNIRNPQFSQTINKNAQGQQHYKLVNLKEEYEQVKKCVSPQHASLLNIFNKTLSILPPTASGILTCPNYASESLITNLITEKPFSFSTNPHLPIPSSHAPPTLLRRGLSVQVIQDPSLLNLQKMNRLLESSFGRSLDTKEFWDRISQVCGSFIIAGDYDGVAIITHEPDPNQPNLPPLSPSISTNNHDFVPYLDKFSVSPDRQGIGVADILWKKVKEMYPDLVWRSRIDNPVNKWYFDRSDGNFILEGNYWMLFWYGTKGLFRLESYRQVALTIPASFISPSIKYSK